MIPKFPIFKTIEIGDREEVEAITKNFPPYSDFNFISMWSWDTKKEMGLSRLNDNLVVRFTDYLTGDPFFSFLGSSEIHKTIEVILDYNNEQNNDASIKLLPKDVAEKIESNIDNLNLFEDIDHHDYIYSIELLSNYEGSALKNHRNSLTIFNRKYPHGRCEIIDLSDAGVCDAILKLYRVWESNKNTSVPHEFIALKKCLSEAESLPIFGIGVFIDDALVGFSINQIESDEYATCFFAKGNIEYSGIYSFLINQTARYLKDKNIKYLNYEQDLGLFSLRKSKEAFAPVYFLKKYCLTKKYD